MIGAPLLLIGGLVGTVVATFHPGGSHDGPGASNVALLASDSASSGMAGLGSAPSGSASASSADSSHAGSPGTSPSTTGSAIAGASKSGPADIGSSATGSTSTGVGATSGSTGSGGTSATTPAATPTPSSTSYDTGWVCRSGGWWADTGLSELPCIRYDNGILYLRGEAKGSYNSPVVIALRVDYGGTYSKTYYSSSFTPSSSGTKTLTVTVGAWPTGESITCEENIDLASSPSDYRYGTNSADIRT